MKSCRGLPGFPNTGVQIGQLTGYNAAELLSDGDKLFKSLVEAEVLGCELKWADDAPPMVSAHPLAEEATVPTKMPAKTDGRISMVRT